jgi:nucleoside permease NupC
LILPLQSLLGLGVLIAFGWAISENRKNIPWKAVGLGVALQFALAWPLLVSANAILREMASFESAGVAEKSVTTAAAA